MHTATIQFITGSVPLAEKETVYDGQGGAVARVLKIDPFILTKKTFDAIPDGEVFKIVVTKLQTVHDPFKATLKFLCQKGFGNDWAIYYGMQYTPDFSIATNGDKVMTKKCVQEICPCDPEVLERYRY